MYNYINIYLICIRVTMAKRARCIITVFKYCYRIAIRGADGFRKEWK
jgi:hypothetical protein